MRSLRARLVAGALLWTLGLIAATHFTVVWLLPVGRGWLVHWGALAVVALGLLVAGLAQVRTGLAPIARLRGRLAAVREGRAARVEGAYPAEVQPLVDDLNALLEDRERSIARAQTRAADLAHGLKTPLAVVSQEVERLRSAGHAEPALALEQQVERMRRQVDYQLSQVRAAASGPRLGAHTSLRVSVDGLLRALERLHAERDLALRAELADQLAVSVERADLDEMLGNLLDNACHWARGRVVLTAAGEPPSHVRIVVDDDGPGLEPALRDRVLQRGARADEAAPGSGLGLAIVRDLAGLYGGELALDGSPLGGLRAVLRLPAA